jgi:hypothetical protein
MLPIYMTDLRIRFKDIFLGGKQRPDYMNLRLDGRVYRIDIDTKKIEKIDGGLALLLRVSMLLFPTLSYCTDSFS